MNRNFTLKSNCIAFVNELGTVKTSASFQRVQSGQELYTIKYNGYMKMESFVRKLRKLYKSFCDELLQLPLVFPDCESRKTFFLNLYKKLLVVKEKIKDMFQLLQRKHPYQSERSCSIKSLREPKEKEFNERYFSSRKEYQNCKAHRMYEIHLDYVMKAIHEMQRLAVAEKIDLSDVREAKEIQKDFARKYRTHLSLPQLSHAVNIFFECICSENLNKMDVANFVAGNFETQKTKNPSKNQVYKKFFDVDDSAKEPVRQLVLEMLNKANKN